jgi:cobalt-zinc-cadmium efflux system protein
MDETHKGHDHNHSIDNFNSINTPFIIGIILNALYVLFEYFYGFFANSVSLLADATHNLLDVGTLLISLLAIKYSSKKNVSYRFTYGYNKTTILASLTNTVILLITSGAIGLEAVNRLIKGGQSSSIEMIWVASLGIIINFISAYLFKLNSKKELNSQAAFIHLLSDALFSLIVVIGGVIIYYTHLQWIDPLLSLILVGFILLTSIRLFKDSLFLAIDAIPKGIDIEKVKSKILSNTKIDSVEHIHIWAISTTLVALTAHIILNENILNIQEEEDLKLNIRHDLNHLGIEHITLEISKTNSSNSCTISSI